MQVSIQLIGNGRLFGRQSIRGWLENLTYDFALATADSASPGSFVGLSPSMECHI